MASPRDDHDDPDARSVADVANENPDPSTPTATLLASTHESRRTLEEGSRTETEDGGRPTFFYRTAQWTTDGTTIIASTSDNKLLSYVLPQDLLAPRDAPLSLGPQGELQLPEPFYAAAPSPYFSLADPASHTVLVSSKDHPLQLHRLFPDAENGIPSPLCCYKLIRRETEEYITAESLLWSWPGTHFLVGSANRLDYFDVTRTGSDGPTLTIPTIPFKRLPPSGSNAGMKGMVSALSIQNPSVLDTPLVAAGTWTRSLGLYDVARSNKAVSNWSIRGVVDGIFDVPDDGNGIVQTLWSPCGRYLVINERKASNLLVYDIRGTGQPINVLAGRRADTQQRLSCDVFAGSEAGFEVWAGTKDGSVVVWENVGSNPGLLEKSWSFDAHHSPIGAYALHPSGSVAASCSGAWAPASDEELDLGRRIRDERVDSASCITDDCSVRIWAIGMNDQDGQAP